MAKLQHVGFDDNQAKALVEMTVGLINATTSPILKQLELLRLDIRRVEKKSDDAIKDHKKSNKIMIFGFIGIIASMVGIIAGLVGVMVTISLKLL